MPETYTKNGKVYTKRENLKNWEDNLKIVTRDNIQKAIKAREDFIDISALLVTPEDDHFLVIGGNTRNLADKEIGTTESAIEIIEFGFDEGTGRWFVMEEGQPRRDKKSFATKLEAMRAYSFLHNMHLAGYSKEAIANEMANPELAEMDWSEMFVNTNEPMSLAEWAEKVAPESLQEIETLSEDPSAAIPQEVKDEVKPAKKAPEGEEEKPIEKTEPLSEPPIMVRCPDCACVFDSREHPAKK